MKLSWKAMCRPAMVPVYDRSASVVPVCDRLASAVILHCRGVISFAGKEASFAISFKKIYHFSQRLMHSSLFNQINTCIFGDLHLLLSHSADYLKKIVATNHLLIWSNPIGERVNPEVVNLNFNPYLR